MHQRTFALLAGWLSGTVLVVTVGIQAVGVVSESVTEDRPAPLSASAVRDALAQDGGAGEPGKPGEPATPGTAPATPGQPGPADSGPTATSATTATTRTSGATGTSGTTGTTGTTRTTGTNRTTGTTGTTGTTTTTRATSSTSAPATQAEDRTYELAGGSASVRFENGSARLLWATPAPGFRVERTDGSNPDEVETRFRSEDHESRLRAFWADGPRAEVEEKKR